MRRLTPFALTLMLVITTGAVAGETVINMPPPPPSSAPHAASGPASSEASAQLPRPGDHALRRYAWSRVYPTYAYYPPRYPGYGYYGTGHYHHGYYGYPVYSYFYPFFAVHHGVMLGNRPFVYTGFGNVTIHD